MSIRRSVGGCPIAACEHVRRVRDRIDAIERALHHRDIRLRDERIREDPSEEQPERTEVQRARHDVRERTAADVEHDAREVGERGERAAEDVAEARAEVPDEARIPEAAAATRDWSSGSFVSGPRIAASATSQFAIAWWTRSAKSAKCSGLRRARVGDEPKSSFDMPHHLVPKRTAPTRSAMSPAASLSSSSVPPKKPWPYVSARPGRCRSATDGRDHRFDGEGRRSVLHDLAVGVVLQASAGILLVEEERCGHLDGDDLRELPRAVAHRRDA